MQNLSYNPKINKLFDLLQKSLNSEQNDVLFDVLDSIKSVENEFLIDYANKKKEGVYYTKSVISNFIFSEALIHLLKNLIDIVSFEYLDKEIEFNNDLKKDIISFLLNLKICDPACGSGVFLVSAVEFLNDLIKKIDPENHSSIIGSKLINNLFGYDINESAIKLAILKLFKWYTSNFNLDLKQIFKQLCSNIEIKDSITSKLDIEFDIIVGNPPYGNILTKNQKLFLKKEKIFFNDIYCSYILKAINWCEGIIGFLVPKSFLLRQSYRDFRHNLLSNANLLKIYDVGPNMFKQATNEVQIVLYERIKKKKNHLQIFEYPNKEIITFKNQNFDNLRSCINSNCPLCDKTKKIFVYTFETRCPYCNSITVPLNRIRIKSNIIINKIISNIEHSGNLNYLNIKNFPNMIRGEEAKGLKQIKKIIKPNTNGSCLFLYAKDDFNYFYFNKNKSLNIESINPDILKGHNYEYYLGPKLLIKHNNIIPQAVFTNDKVCFSSSIYSILHKNDDELKYLCALLNSSLIQFYCTFGINNQKSTTINLNQYMIRHLPIKDVDQEIKSQISQKTEFIINNLRKKEGFIDKTTSSILKELDKTIFQIYEISKKDQEIIISQVKKKINFFNNIYSNLK